MAGDAKKAREMGVKVGFGDWAVFVACSLFIGARKGLYALAARLPGLREATDRMLVRKLETMLRSYGHAEFTSDAATYRPAHVQQAAE